MSVSKDIVKIKDRVEYILEKHPVTRDCDKSLWIAYLFHFHNLKNNVDMRGFEGFKDVLLDHRTPTMEGVRRVRQKFQEKGKFLGKKRLDKLEEAENVKIALRGW